MTGQVVTVVMTISVVMTSDAEGVVEEEAAAEDPGGETAGVVLAAAVLSGVLDVVSTPWLEDEAGVEAGVVWAAEDSGVVTAADDAGVVAWEVCLVLVVDW